MFTQFLVRTALAKHYDAEMGNRPSGSANCEEQVQRLEEAVKDLKPQLGRIEALAKDLKEQVEFLAED